MDVFLSAALIAVVVLLATAAAHNGLAALRQDVRDAWAAMDAELRHRYDLLPPLVVAARSNGRPAPPALAAVLSARNRAAVAFNPQQLAEAESALTRHVHELFDAADPDLARRRPELLAAEGRIGRAIRRYNDAVSGYNAVRASFPHDLVAAVFGYTAQVPFDGPTDR